MVPLPEVGVYGVGYQLASILPVIALAVSNAWLPRYFASAETGEGQETYLKVLGVYSVLIAVLVTILVALAPPIVALIAGPEYSGSAGIMQVVALGMSLHAVFQVLILVQLYEKKGINVSVATGIAVVVNVLILIYLVPKMGIVGAAWATGAAYIAALCYLLKHAAKILRKPVLRLVKALFPLLAVVTVLAIVSASHTHHSILQNLDSPLLFATILVLLAVIGLKRTQI